MSKKRSSRGHGKHAHKKGGQSSRRLSTTAIEGWKQVFQSIASTYPTVLFIDHGLNGTYQQANFSLEYNLANSEGFITAFLLDQMKKGDASPLPQGALAWISISSSLSSLLPHEFTLPSAMIQRREFKQ